MTGGKYIAAERGAFEVRSELRLEVAPPSCPPPTYRIVDKLTDMDLILWHSFRAGLRE